MNKVLLILALIVACEPGTAPCAGLYCPSDAGIRDTGADTSNSADASSEASADAANDAANADANDAATSDAALDAEASDAMASDATAMDSSVNDASADDAAMDSAVADAATPSRLETVLRELETDLSGALPRLARTYGFPIALEDGSYLFVSTSASATRYAGDDNNFVPEPMNQIRADGLFRFAYIVRSVPTGTRYKFASESGDSFVPDPLSRTYAFDNFGEISFVSTTNADRAAYPLLYERHLAMGSDEIAPRTVRVLVPTGNVTHVLYAHDGENLFRTDSSMRSDFTLPYGGWHLDDEARAHLLVVAIHTGPNRYADYTHVPETQNTFGTPFGEPTGGSSDNYARFVALTLIPYIDSRFGTTNARRGLVGSSLGGLVSFDIAERYPTVFHFVAAMSASFGWGSFANSAPADGDRTMIDRYRGRPHLATRYYVDSGGDQRTTCVDSDGDGIEDDAPGGDNYCVTLQMRNTLAASGYVLGTDLFYVHDVGLSGFGAEHREDAWAYRARTFVFPRFLEL